VHSGAPDKIAQAAIMQSGCEPRRLPVLLNRKEAVSAMGFVKSMMFPLRIDEITFFWVFVTGPLQNSDQVMVETAAMFPFLSQGSNIAPRSEVVKLI
jgi:hypothetical protein